CLATRLFCARKHCVARVTQCISIDTNPYRVALITKTTTAWRRWLRLAHLRQEAKVRVFHSPSQITSSRPTFTDSWALRVTRKSRSSTSHMEPNSCSLSRQESELGVARFMVEVLATACIPRHGTDHDFEPLAPLPRICLPEIMSRTDCQISGSNSNHDAPRGPPVVRGSSRRSRPCKLSIPL